MIHKGVPAGEHRQPAWQSFFAVSNVDAAKRVALQHGAKVLFEPHSVPERGREAVFTDPQGPFLRSSLPRAVIRPMSWLRRENGFGSRLITSDPDTDAAFYQTLFDYEVFELPAIGRPTSLACVRQLCSRKREYAACERPKAHPHWLNYIRVEDAVKMAAKVVALGGRVLIEPRVDRHGGKVAVVADPLGAPFGLLEWPDTESKEVIK